MNRRLFVKQILWTMALLFAMMGFVVWYKSKNWRHIMEDIIRTDTAQLNIDEAVYQKFLNDIAQPLSWMPLSDAKIKFLQIFHPYQLYKFPSKYTTIYHQTRSDVVAWFLLSTNYFRSNTTKIVKIEYIMLYHPYQMPCSNPFSSIFYPAKF